MNARTLALFYSLMLGSAFIFLGVYAVVPEFRSLFQGFGADLPWLTRFVIATYKFSALLPLVMVVPYIQRLSRQSIALRSDRALRGYAFRTFGVSIVVLSTCVIAMYLPIFKMGAVI